MEEINMRELIKFYYKKINIILIFLLVAFVLGLGYVNIIQKPVYSSLATLTLRKEIEENITGVSLSQIDILVNQKLINSYSKIIKSRKVLSRVIDDLNLNYAIKSLAKDIKVEQIPGTEIMEIIVVNENANNAYDIANSLISILKEEAAEIYGLRNIEVIDAPLISDESFRMQKIKKLIIITGGGILSGIIYVFSKFYFVESKREKKY